MTRIEVSIYQPAEEGKESLFIALWEIGTNEILFNQTADLGFRSGIPDDSRPIYVAFRRKDGDVSSIGYAVFSFTLLRRTRELDGIGELARESLTTDTKVVEFDPSEVLSTDEVWHPFLLALEDAVEISRVQVRWGELEAPSGVPSAPASEEEGEVTLFAQADPATIP